MRVQQVRKRSVGKVSRKSFEVSNVQAKEGSDGFLDGLPVNHLLESILKVSIHTDSTSYIITRNYHRIDGVYVS